MYFGLETRNWRPLYYARRGYNGIDIMVAAATALFRRARRYDFLHPKCELIKEVKNVYSRNPGGWPSIFKLVYPKKAKHPDIRVFCQYNFPKISGYDAKYMYSRLFIFSCLFPKLSSFVLRPFSHWTHSPLVVTAESAYFKCAAQWWSNVCKLSGLKTEKIRFNSFQLIVKLKISKLFRLICKSFFVLIKLQLSSIFQY